MSTGPHGPEFENGSPPAHTTAHLSRIEADERQYGPIDSDARAAVEALPPESALLIVQHGPNAGARFLLDTERATAGRDTKADIFLDDVTVSRKHAEFLKEGSNFVVRDVGSLNGTYVNRTRVDEGVLHVGDEVQIGKYRLTFHPSPNRPTQAETGAGEPNT
ncbi:MAG TPA: FHA domain-containing protein [Beutenbergiaceae bacterium]|nr:FHA domain-containing protein [Beutenbergiaceae bacterium]